jgi:hypothetical protein
MVITIALHVVKGLFLHISPKFALMTAVGRLPSLTIMLAEWQVLSEKRSSELIEIIN